MRLANLLSMANEHRTPIQIETDSGIGLRLANAIALKSQRRSKDLHKHKTRALKLNGDVVADTISLGSDALLRHVVQLLQDRPVQVIAKGPMNVRIRVCGALDYVIDRARREVRVEPSPLTCRERTTKLHPPWTHPLMGKDDRVDVLNTLCRPKWLAYIAGRPGWFGYAAVRCAPNQEQLFVEQELMDTVLTTITERVWRLLKDDPLLIILRHQLSKTLTLHIGPSLINLAIRARIEPSKASLVTQHLNLVWRHHEAFQTLERENPKLLVALSAWLLHDRENERVLRTDALPAMVRKLAEEGLPPRAWRVLAANGIKRLLPSQMIYPPWKSLIVILKAMHASRWPALAPRGLLRLLHDSAGVPDTFETASGGVPGWFWQMVCNEAVEHQSDTLAYRDLFDSVPRWAWIVRTHALKPDKNQRRRGCAWLREAVRLHDESERQNGAVQTPTWALWTEGSQWPQGKDFVVVPLLSPHAMLQEAFAMHNCADDYITRCRNGNELLLSLRNSKTGRRIALASVTRHGMHWSPGQIAGPCNEPVSLSIRQFVKLAVNEVNRQYAQHLISQKRADREASEWLEL